jgi:phosphoribosylglycinamide formyltransferase 1
MIAAFPNKIINIHPALLPDFGGKGMYGHKVHEAVIAAGKAFSGITIHYVNEKYDDGAILMQQQVAVEKNDSPDTLAAKIHQLEYKYYPEVINSLLG